MITIGLLVFGLIIGSFLGALTYRLPRRISIIKGRSFCPSCKAQINWYDNIPLISYVLLQGKCRDCSSHISRREPLIELATGIIFIFVGLNIFNLILASILIAIFVIDFENQIIPDELVFGGILIAVCKLIFTSSFLYPNLLASFLSALILLMISLITHGKGMGLGDVKLALLIGLLVGLKFFLVWLFFSFLIGAVLGLFLIIIKKAKLRQRIAFGPFLIFGIAMVLFFGDYFIKLIGL
ncbi:MAG TPA: prepilin peptidase [Patescibacteria group bacterium]|nr:prepilin peptidase [Patescibacteria group bacterium]